MAPIFFIPKKDTTEKRIIIDYRYWNKWTVKNTYPLSLINQLLDSVRGCDMFTKMDVRWGYNNVRSREGDELKCAFVTPLASYEPLVMFFGQCNAPATFQNMMNDVFVEFLYGFLIIYMDDCLVFTKRLTRGEHMQKVHQILQKMRENDLYLKIGKCEFAKPEMEFLGWIVDKNGLRMDPKKISAVTKWQSPTRVKGIRSFLGMANFYRPFIPKFAEMARPLTELTKKDAVFKWGERQQTAFDMLKEEFVKEPTLTYADPSKPLRVEADASKFATRATLCVKTDEGWKPSAYMTHKFSGAEINWTVYDKELYAIYAAFVKWRHWLLPAQHTIEVWCEHRNLSYFRRPQVLTPKQANWYSTMQEYHYEIKAKAGSQNGRADALSRKEEDESTERVETTLVLKAIQPGVDKKKVLYNCHDHATAGHFGVRKTYKRIRDWYNWPGMYRDVEQYVARCSICAQNKGHQNQPSGAIQSLPVPETPWQDISVDLVTGLPMDEGFDAVCTVVDRFSKEINIFPVTSTLTAQELAVEFKERIWRRHGLPKSILSDRGPQFISSFWQELMERTDVKPRLTSPYHPQGDGQTERMQWTWLQYLCMYAKEKNWVSRLTSTIKLHPVINISYLKKYIEREDDNPIQILKEPKLLDWSKEFEVRKIINHHQVGRGFQFLVEWEGWERDEATWEPSASLKNAPQAVAEYLHAHPEVPKPH